MINRIDFEQTSCTVLSYKASLKKIQESFSSLFWMQHIAKHHSYDHIKHHIKLACTLYPIEVSKYMLKCNISRIWNYQLTLIMNSSSKYSCFSSARYICSKRKGFIGMNKIREWMFTVNHDCVSDDYLLTDSCSCFWWNYL